MEKCNFLFIVISFVRNISLLTFTYLLYTPCNLLNILFWFDSNNRFCLHCFVLLPYLSSFGPTATNLFVNYFSTFSFYIELPFKLLYGAFILQFPFSHLIVLTLCVISSASLKFFISYLVCLLSFPCFCKPQSQQQYCQQHVILSLFLYLFQFLQEIQSC